MIMMGHPEAWEAAWGVVRLVGVVQLLGDLETSLTALKIFDFDIRDAFRWALTC